MARIGNNILVAQKLRVKQLNFLLENMREPVFSPGTVSDNELNANAITFRILNTLGHNRGHQSIDDAPSYGTVAYFMNSIQEYFPKNMRVKYKLWEHTSYRDTEHQVIADETREALDRAVDWLQTMREMIVDRISENYFFGGKLQYLEILKRRYKELYSEKIEQQVNADVKEDSTINIIIEEDA